VPPIGISLASNDAHPRKRLASGFDAMRLRPKSLIVVAGSNYCEALLKICAIVLLSFHTEARERVAR